MNLDLLDRVALFAVVNQAWLAYISHKGSAVLDSPLEPLGISWVWLAALTLVNVCVLVACRILKRRGAVNGEETCKEKIQ